MFQKLSNYFISVKELFKAGYKIVFLGDIYEIFENEISARMDTNWNLHNLHENFVSN